MLKITFLVFMPLGHTRLHFPQSMHLLISFSSSSEIPRRRRTPNFLTLKLIRFEALQLAVQQPQDMQIVNEGSLRNT